MRNTPTGKRVGAGPARKPREIRDDERKKASSPGPRWEPQGSAGPVSARPKYGSAEWVRQQREAEEKERAIWFANTIPEPESPIEEPGSAAETKVTTYKCFRCNTPIELADYSAVCPGCGTKNRRSDDEKPFDVKVDEAGQRSNGLGGWLRAAIKVNDTTASWGQLEDLEELPLRETRYWQMSINERLAEGRKWAKLASLEIPRPNDADRRELIKLFGSTPRAKSFFIWMRIITPEGFDEALRWLRCDSCGDDLLFPAFGIGLVECERCRVTTDITIHGDEIYRHHMTQRCRMNYNKLPRPTGRKLMPLMPEAEIIRPSAGTGRSS